MAAVVETPHVVDIVETSQKMEDLAVESDAANGVGTNEDESESDYFLTYNDDKPHRAPPCGHTRRKAGEPSEGIVSKRRDSLFSGKMWRRKSNDSEADSNFSTDSESRPTGRRDSLSRLVKRSTSFRKARRSKNSDELDRASAHGYLESSAGPSGRRDSLGQRVKKSMSFRKSKSHPEGDIERTSTTDEIASTDGVEKYDYEDVNPSGRRDSLGRRVKKSMSFRKSRDNQSEGLDRTSAHGCLESSRDSSRRRGSIGQRVKQSMSFRKAKENPEAPAGGEDALAESEKYGYEEAAPSRRRRNSIGRKIRIRRKSKASETNDSEYGDDDQEGQGPNRRRRNSLADRIMFWTGAVKKEHSESALSVLQADTDQHRAPEDEDGAENRRPHRRSSLSDRIMVWAGAVNQEHFRDKNTLDTTRTGPRRASVDFTGPSLEDNNGESTRPVRRSATDEVLDEMKKGDDEYRTRQGQARRRSSLHAMVERAMAMVNLKPEEEEPELCAFGTRRDSLF